MELNSKKMIGLVSFVFCVSAIFVACDKAKFTHKSPLPEIDETLLGQDDFDGGSDDTVVTCRQEDWSNICLDDNIQSIPVGSTFYLPNPSSVNQLPVSSDFPGVSCFSNVYTNTRRPTVPLKGVELWLVVDSSNSFDKERTAVAKAILDGFMKSCRLGVPVEISVIAAHTPDSPDSSAHGSPFFSQNGERRTVVIHENMSRRQLQEAERTLLSKLGSNMRRDPRSENYHHDIGHSGADELGLLALYNALDRVERKPHHALTIIFMSDENDICKGEFNGDPDGHENHMNALYCDGISPVSVYTKLRQFAGDRPLVLSAAVYSGKRPVVNESPNGIGRGYLDIVELAGGRSIELSPLPGSGPNQYIEQMSRDVAIVAGNMTYRYATYYAHYPIFSTDYQSIFLSQVAKRPGSRARYIRVKVDGQVSGFSLDPRYSLVTPNRSGERVEIEYCQQSCSTSCQ